MRLFYTGAEKEGDVQENPNQSLGGYVSGSVLPNGSINNLFGSISQYAKEKSLRQVRAVVLKNETGASQSPILWYDNVSSEPITNYRFAFVTLAMDDCGWFMEEIGQGDALPINATFINPLTQPNSISLPVMPADGYIGIWIERTFNSKAVSDSDSCENLLEKFDAENQYQVSTIQFPADVADSLDGKYFNLDTLTQQFTFWFSTGAGATQPSIIGRDLIKVSIATGATADDVAAAVASQLNILVDPRGEVESTVINDTVTVTATQYGPFPIPVDIDSGATVTSVALGTFNGLETKEEIEVTIQY